MGSWNPYIPSTYIWELQICDIAYLTWMWIPRVGNIFTSLCKDNRSFNLCKFLFNSSLLGYSLILQLYSLPLHVNMNSNLHHLVSKFFLIHISTANISSHFFLLINTKLSSYLDSCILGYVLSLFWSCFWHIFQLLSLSNTVFPTYHLISCWLGVVWLFGSLRCHSCEQRPVWSSSDGHITLMMHQIICLTWVTWLYKVIKVIWSHQSFLSSYHHHLWLVQPFCCLLLPLWLSFFIHTSVQTSGFPYSHRFMVLSRSILSMAADDFSGTHPPLPVLYSLQLWQL